MEFSRDLRPDVISGDVTVSYRLWRRPKVRVGGRYPVGPAQIEVDSVELVPFDSITAADMLRSGEADRESLRRRAAHAGPIEDDTLLYRVEFHLVDEPPPGPGWETGRMAEPVTMAVLGAGSRGTTYAGFAAQSGGRAQVVAVVEPRAERREALAGELGVPADMRFADWRELAARPRLADAVIVATPDREHVGPATTFAGLGYHVLLEKPIAPTWDECLAVVEAVERAGVILAVCHVMRYTAYTGAVRRVVAGGALGQVVGVEHLEPVGWWHFAHSYVRGNWRREGGSGPSLLTKCCHDLDWLRHIVGRPAVSVSSRGGLHHFTAASRPPGAADRCLDCAIEPECPYSATRLYLGFLGDPKRRTWPLPVLTTDLTERGVRQALRDGPYGRCVYACDNDVADHQVVTIEFDGGVTATLTMSAFTPYGRRRTRIMGTRGFLEGDGHAVTVTDFVTGRSGPTELADPAADAGGGHGGGDYGAIGAFVDAVASGDRSLVRTGPRESLESHLMAFAAERSRLTGAPVGVAVSGR